MIKPQRRPGPLSWLLGLAIFAGYTGLASPAFADFVDTGTVVDITATDTTTTDTTVVDDPLHVYFPGSVDNGTNTPTSTYPASFGFTTSPASVGRASGDFIIDILVPNNEFASWNYTISGTKLSPSGHVQTGSETASLVSYTPWTGGTLAQYLGLWNASPTNSFGAFDCQPAGVCANAYDPGLTGFYVYQADLGQTLLQGSSNPDYSPILNISSGLPPASYIVAFLNTSSNPWQPSWIATANSGALLYTAIAAPEPSSLAILAAAMLGLGAMRYRRRA